MSLKAARASLRTSDPRSTLPPRVDHLLDLGSERKLHFYPQTAAEGWRASAGCQQRFVATQQMENFSGPHSANPFQPWFHIGPIVQFLLARE